MSLVSQLKTLATRVGTEIKGLVRPDHPGLARAWVNFGYVGSAIQISSSHNVAGVARLAAGRYRVTFSTPFADTNYCWLAFARSNTNSNTQRMAIIRATTDTKTSAYVEVICATATGSLADTTEFNLMVFR
ncbi:MAG: hypothetical protein CO125_04050 [Hydrogenophilales bacterium CG_4_9_14_3_um_filter_59_35]|nr:MAG: hypothetical protein COW70_02260 [Hydrogenophilales bacterium CG18_big_fil_WC_8_21_14_2_50_58_12]PIY01603.1 MAG: hypothetical protein COZ23_02335 [Hydrogenophilales bacterium CG_4_10_14_3_um_filter_58_23]PJB07742.1 MAG: hypothetical protein CO125_04050 [Hydrogenophilales bacterium CG_4_9_14_3_um_filter_59_35]